MKHAESSRPEREQGFARVLCVLGRGSRRTRVLAGLWFYALLAVGLAWETGGHADSGRPTHAERISAAPDPGVARERFRHSNGKQGDDRVGVHVRALWWNATVTLESEGDRVQGMLVNPGKSFTNEEYRQDCLPCHSDFPQPGEAPADRDRTATCTRCHVAGSMEIARLADAAPLAQEGRAGFWHTDHDTLSCKNCHLPAPGALDGPAEFGIPVPTPSWCTACHGRSSELGTRLLDRIDERSGQSTARFSHLSHLSPGVLERGGEELAQECLKCHKTFDADSHHLNERQFDITACSECHQGQEFRLAPAERESQVAATFVHWDHDPRRTSENPLGLQELKCVTCHELLPDSGHVALREELFPEGDTYAGCAQCHEDRRVSNHGDLGGCAGCHAVQADSLTHLAAMPKNRPRVSVLRPDITSFSFKPLEHPHITGDRVSEDCSECHRASLEAIESRLQERPFNHATHLPPGFGTLDPSEIEETCARCHSRVRGSGRPVPGSKRGASDLKACEDCHDGGFDEQRFKEQERQALRFSHRQHMTYTLPEQNGRLVHCLDCHSQAEGLSGETGMGIAPDAADCTRCHGHGSEEFANRSAGLNLDEAHACAICHVAGIPAQGEPIAVERGTVERGAGQFKHSRGEDCSSCHFRPSTSRAASEPALSARKAFVLHGGLSDRADWKGLGAHFEKFAGHSGPKGSVCLRCHWGNLDTPAKGNPQLFLKKNPRFVWNDYGTPVGEEPGPESAQISQGLVPTFQD